MVALLAIGAGGYVAWTYVFVHQVQVAKEMNWRCVPDAATAAHPSGQTVRLSFAENPAFVDTVSGRDLCDQLERSGRPVVRVTFTAWGNRSRGLVGYREDAIDGRAIQYVGAPGGSIDLGSGSHPLGALFR
jgi:hypothetical protein